MAQKLLIAFVFICLLVQCKKEEKDEPVPEPAGCLMIGETINDLPYRLYEYAENNQLFRIQQYQSEAPNKLEKRFSFDYDLDGRVATFRETNLLSPFINYQYELIYSSESTLDTIRKYQVFNSGPRLIETYILTYDAQKRITTYAWGENYWRYEYDDAGNLTKWFAKITSVINQEILVAEYDNYDEKENIYSDVYPAQLINLVAGGGSSKANPGSFKFYLGTPTPSQTGIVTYEYNEKNFPTQASTTIFRPTGGATTQVYKFEYECL
ncbi:hypothetical protein [Arundinibacter roseus]|uniref:DUF4595 domain-containing protein n=1 Tax=Arundinibacter roseus TaxID=2070510 RepID=A0A4R4KBS1_9BACT|nr:hypothetical protein [Arundinibacter roseus]TDB65248.1 hypothetical protein EZE20_11115 [Arundinibacter roseus]